MSEKIIIDFVVDNSQLVSSVELLKQQGKVTDDDAEKFTLLGNKAKRFYGEQLGLVENLGNRLQTLRAARDQSTDPAKITRINAILKEQSVRYDELTGKAKKVADEGTKSFGGFEEKIKSIGKTLLAAFAFERIVSFGKESVKAFQEAEKNAILLKTAVTSNGGLVSDFENLLSQSEKLQKTTIFSDDDIQRAQTFALQFGLTGDEVEKLIPIITDYASATGKDLNSAIETVIQGINGQGRELKKSGIIIDTEATRAERFADIQQKLTDKFKGQAEVVGGTSGGELQKLGNRYDDLKEKVGQFLTGFVFGIKDANETSLENIAINQKVAKSSEALLSEYESLTKDGIVPNKEEKQRLTEITYQLRDSLGESVVSIDKETGALVLNKDAVKEAIKQKLLLANNEASTLALQVNALNEISTKQKAAAVDFAKNMEAREASLKRLNLTQKDVDDFTKEVVSGQLGSRFNAEQKEFLQTYTNLDDKRKIATTEANNADKEKIALLEKLNKLGFDELAVQKLFNAESGKKQESTLGNKTQDELDKEAQKEKAFLEKQAALREQIRQKISASELAGIADELEKRKEAERKSFADNVTIVEKGVSDGLIKREEGVEAIKRLEKNLQDALTKIDQDGVDERAKIVQDVIKKQSEENITTIRTSLDLSTEQEKKTIIENYIQKGDTSKEAEETLQKELLAVDRKYNALKIQEEKDTLQRLIDAGVDVESNKAKLKSLEVAEAKTANDEMLSDYEKSQKAQEEAAKKTADIKKQIAKDVADNLIELATEVLAAQLFYDDTKAEEDERRVNDDLDRRNEANDAETAALEKKLERGLISESQFNKEKAKLDDKKDKDELNAKKKLNELKKQQDISERDRAVFQIGIDTLRNVVSQPGPFGTLIPYWIGLGATQAALVLAKPLPKYHTGQRATLDSSEEVAVVRKDEDIFDPKKSRDYAPTFRAIHDGKINSKVINDFVNISLKPTGSFAQNVTASIDYKLLAKEIGGEVAWKMRGDKTVGLSDATIIKLAKTLEETYDPRIIGRQ